jgi:hypothetical protein
MSQQGFQGVYIVVKSITISVKGDRQEAGMLSPGLILSRYQVHMMHDPKKNYFMAESCVRK